MQNDFKELIYGYVGSIPKGKVMTYGQLSALAGSPRAARIVGSVAHWGPDDLPWHRVVNRFGGLASAYTWGGREGQAKALREDGVEVSAEYTVDVKKLIWYPELKINNDV